MAFTDDLLFTLQRINDVRGKGSVASLADFNGVDGKAVIVFNARLGMKNQQRKFRLQGNRVTYLGTTRNIKGDKPKAVPTPDIPMTFRVVDPKTGEILNDNATQDHAWFTMYGKPTSDDQPYYKDLEIGKSSHYVFQASGEKTYGVVTRTS